MAHPAEHLGRAAGGGRARGSRLPRRGGRGVGREELLERLRRGDVVLVDVRPPDEFEAGHIDGARSIPIDELERRLDELPGDRRCRLLPRAILRLAHEAVRRLHAAGRRARRLEEGWPEWQSGRVEEEAGAG